MNIDCSIALDTLSIVYMLVLIFNQKYKYKKELLNFRYFQITIAICLLLMLDIAYMLLYGHADLPYIISLKIVKSFYLIVNSLIVWLWAKYIDYLVYDVRFKQKKYRFFYTGVLTLNILLVVVNFFTDILFKISSDGIFTVTPAGMWIFTLLNYSSLLMATVILVKNRKSIRKSSFLPLLVFPIPSLCAEIIQIFYRPFSLICAYAVSALTVFQVSQNYTIYTDSLTGLANRRLLDESLQQWFSEPKDAVICGIMIDLDNLKYINDTYGHLSGDNAILSLAEILKKIDRKDLLTARYGGDEFVIAWLSDIEEDAVIVKNMILSLKEEFNQTKSDSEKIDFSMGHGCCRDIDNINASEFLMNIDAAMYQCKRAKKLANLNHHAVSDNKQL